MTRRTTTEAVASRTVCLALAVFLTLRVSELGCVCTRHGETLGVALVLVLIAAVAVCSGLVRIALAAVVFSLVKYRLDSDLALPSALHSDLDLAGTVAVITGASSGIGLALAAELAAHNATLVLGCRNMDKCEARKPPGDVACLKLDLADLTSVAAFAAAVRAREARVDYLVNNAGLVAGSGARSQQGFEVHVGVMHLGHFLLTRELWPLLQRPHPAGAAARVVNHASAAFGGGRMHRSLFHGEGEGDLRGEVTDGCISYRPATWAARDAEGSLAVCPVRGSYSHAKLMQVLFTQELAARAGEWGGRPVLAATLHPGTVQSGLVPLPDWIVRPTEGGARVLLHCLFGNITTGSYVDEMLGVHDFSNSVTDPQAGRPATSWFSLPIHFHREATEGRGEEMRLRLWEVSDRVVAPFASRDWPTVSQ